MGLINRWREDNQSSPLARGVEQSSLLLEQSSLLPRGADQSSLLSRGMDHQRSLRADQIHDLVRAKNHLNKIKKVKGFFSHVSETHQGSISCRNTYSVHFCCSSVGILNTGSILIANSFKVGLNSLNQGNLKRVQKEIQEKEFHEKSLLRAGLNQRTEVKGNWEKDFLMNNSCREGLYCIEEVTAAENDVSWKSDFWLTIPLCLGWEED